MAKMHTRTREAATAFAKERARRDREPMFVFVRWDDPPIYYVYAQRAKVCLKARS